MSCVSFFLFTLSLLLYLSKANTIDCTTCKEYSDGCNDCTCDLTKQPTCSVRSCFVAGTPKCTACYDGYGLYNNTCIKVTSNALTIDCNNCTSYNDGCNECNCNENKVSCTERACFTLNKPFCISCKPGYNISSDQSTNPGCYPTTPTTTTSSQVDCQNCTSYYDGCNSCSCGDNGLTMCTLKYCDPQTITNPYCTACKTGYDISKDQINNPLCYPILNKYKIGCNNCTSFYDGCNNCICDENGYIACTKKYCITNNNPYCTKCQDNYTLANNKDKYPGCYLIGNVPQCKYWPCMSYYDGCNTCSCQKEIDSAACTEMACQQSVIDRNNAGCRKCADGYELRDDGHCYDGNGMRVTDYGGINKYNVFWVMITVLVAFLLC